MLARASGSLSSCVSAPVFLPPAVLSQTSAVVTRHTDTLPLAYWDSVMVWMTTVAGRVSQEAVVMVHTGRSGRGQQSCCCTGGGGGNEWLRHGGPWHTGGASLMIRI